MASFFIWKWMNAINGIILPCNKKQQQRQQKTAKTTITTKTTARNELNNDTAWLENVQSFYLCHAFGACSKPIKPILHFWSRKSKAINKRKGKTAMMHFLANASPFSFSVMSNQVKRHWFDSFALANCSNNSFFAWWFSLLAKSHHS